MGTGQQPSSLRQCRCSRGFNNADKFNHLMASELVTFPRHVRHLVIDHWHNWNTRFSSQFDSDFQSLTQLCIVDCHFDSFSDLVNFLLTCHVLEDLSLDDSSWRCTSNSVPVAGSLPNLRHPAIRFATVPEDIIAWLLFLQPVPALQYFAFNSRDEMGDLQINLLLQILGTSLRHLNLGGAVSHLWNLSHNGPAAVRLLPNREFIVTWAYQLKYSRSSDRHLRGGHVG